MKQDMPFSALEIPHVSAGHFELAWNPNDEVKVAQAAALVDQLLHDGYMLVKEVAPGKWERVTYFDARRPKVGIATSEEEFLNLTAPEGTATDAAVALPPTARGADPFERR